MKQEPQIVADFTGKAEAHEGLYTQVRDIVQIRLHKALMIRNAIASYEMKLERASMELDNELSVIDGNYSERLK